MALILQKAWLGYKILFEEIVDPRTKPWLLIAKPYQCISLLALYLLFVLKWGPKWMKNRPPFNLDKLLIVYNALQVMACFYVLLKGLELGWWSRYKWICEPVDFSFTPHAIEVTEVCYYYFLLKVVDLLDTVFFVLRKKHNQVSFLHCYHHAGMVLLIWACVTYQPGGHGTLVGVINCFVHVVMYSYYLLTVAFPGVKNAIWFKRLITQLQIGQFFWCVVHMGALVFKTDCEYPRWTAAVFLPQNLFMLILFLDFYIKTYIMKPKVKLSNKLNNEKNSKNDIDRPNGNKININYDINKLNEINSFKSNLSKSDNKFEKIISASKRLDKKYKKDMFNYNSVKSEINGYDKLD